MTKAPVDRLKVSKFASFCIILILFAMFVLTGCERPATRSTWSPIEDANRTATASALPSALPATIASLESGNTPEAPESTPESMGTLDTSELPAQLPDSVKGYDLYSWQSGELWNFTLITGTNRMKEFDEIIAPGNIANADGFIKVSVTGVDELKKLLLLLPAGEDVLWGGMDLGGQVPTGTVYLTLPPQDMIDELIVYCNNMGINLTAIRPQ